MVHRVCDFYVRKEGNKTTYLYLLVLRWKDRSILSHLISFGNFQKLDVEILENTNPFLLNGSNHRLLLYDGTSTLCGELKQCSLSFHLLCKSLALCWSTGSHRMQRFHTGSFPLGTQQNRELPEWYPESEEVLGKTWLWGKYPLLVLPRQHSQNVFSASSPLGTQITWDLE